MAVHRVDWPEVFARLERMPVPLGARVYGVPRGGAIVAGLLAATGRVDLVGDPEQATLIVDDIIDSGRTRQRFNGAPFLALVDKPAEGLNGAWVEFVWEQNETPAEDAVVRLLEMVGQDPSRDGLRDTPRRVVSMLRELTVGYGQDPATILGTVFDESRYDEMVVLRDIPFTSLCEHHLLPFTGTASLAYVPRKRVVGISKLARLVDCYAARLQLQERLTAEVADAMMAHLQPLGAAAVLRASHLCMVCRGVRKPGSEMVTSAMLGVFREKPEARAEVLRLLER